MCVSNSIIIDKEVCYLFVTLVLPASTALGNTQVTPLAIYSNVHTVDALHSTALQQLNYTKTHTISPTFQGNTKVTPRGVTWLFPSVT